MYDEFVDHGRWLRWNPHMREMTPLSEGPLVPGFRARLAARFNPFTSTWVVTEVNPGRSFAWTSSSFFPGLRLVFDHIAEASGSGTRATIRIGVEGPLAYPVWLAGGFFGGRFLARSLHALKERLEVEAAGPSAPQEEPGTGTGPE